MEQIDNREISISEVLRTAFQLWKENFILIATVITIVFIPIQILIECASMIIEESRVLPLEDQSWRSILNEVRIYDLIRQLISTIAILGIFNYIYSKLRSEENDKSAFEVVKYGLKKWPINFAKIYGLDS